MAAQRSQLYRYTSFEKFLRNAAIASIVLGLIIMAAFLYRIHPFLSFAGKGKKLDANATAMVGSFIEGVVGTVWALAGVVLFYLALRLQSRELGLQIDELKQTREVFSIQQFENTFFNLLKTQNDIRQQIQVTNDFYQGFGSLKLETKVYTAHEAFDYIRGKIQEDYQSLVKDYSSVNIPDELYAAYRQQPLVSKLKEYYDIDDVPLLSIPGNIAKMVYRRYFTLYHNQLGHYFRNLYHILAYLQDNEIRELAFQFFDDESDADRVALSRRKYTRYAQFVQAQMSSAELFLVFYNGLFFSKTKKLIHHYDFLENLTADDLLDPAADPKLYGACTIEGIVMPEVTMKSRKEILVI